MNSFNLPEKSLNESRYFVVQFCIDSPQHRDEQLNLPEKLRNEPLGCHSILSKLTQSSKAGILTKSFCTLFPHHSQLLHVLKEKGTLTNVVPS